MNTPAGVAVVRFLLPYTLLFFCGCKLVDTVLDNNPSDVGCSASSRFSSGDSQCGNAYLQYPSGASYDFEAQRPNSSITKTITLKNNGESTAKEISIGAFTGTIFQLVSGSTTCKSTLGSGESCLIGVQFTPPDTTSKSATLSVSYHDGIQTKTAAITVKGNGTKVCTTATDLITQTTGTTTFTGSASVAMAQSFRFRNSSYVSSISVYMRKQAATEIALNLYGGSIDTSNLVTQVTLSGSQVSSTYAWHSFSIGKELNGIYWFSILGNGSFNLDYSPTDLYTDGYFADYGSESPFNFWASRTSYDALFKISGCE